MPENYNFDLYIYDLSKKIHLDFSGMDDHKAIEIDSQIERTS